MDSGKDPRNEQPIELSSRVDVETTMEAYADKNLGQTGSSNAEGKESGFDEKDAVDELQTKAAIQTDVRETDTQGKAKGYFNMESTMTADDVERAGGFGETDDIGSLLPVALDSTDFEASLRNARDYEEEQGGVSRPGLGWSKTRETD